MTARIETIAVIGAGALGAVYASILHDLCAHSVCFISRGSRYDRLRRDGVVVNGKRYEITVVRPEEATPADLLIVGGVRGTPYVIANKFRSSGDTLRNCEQV